MSYEPHPGTIAYRALVWLRGQPAGTEVTSSMWAEAIDSDGNTLTMSLKPALHHGLIKQRTRDGATRPFWFSLGDGVQPEKAQEDEETVLPPKQRIVSAAEAPPMVPAAAASGLDVPRFTGEAAAVCGRPEVLLDPAGEEQKPGPVTWVPAEQPTRPAEPEPKPAEFDYCLFRDGTLRLWGVEVNDDGSVSITAAQLHEIRGRVAWLPAPSHQEAQP